VRQVSIPTADSFIRGDLVVPDLECAVILFAHGSGSGRLSSRNKQVARYLNEQGLGTLLIDLLTEEEEQIDRQTGHLRFDIGFLADRLRAATRWLEEDFDTASRPIGYFGASTGAAAALAAAISFPSRVRAIVSRGGRPDLAAGALTSVTAPTLLVVGSLDAQVLELNRRALESIQVEKELIVVEGATHLFEEPGKLEEVAALSAEWFRNHLC
jgi:dienelactone hydrolase